ILLFNLECANIAEKNFTWQPLAVPTCLRSSDKGITWDNAQPVGDEPGRIWDVVYRDGVIYALELCNDSSIKWYGNLPEHHYSLYVSEDQGRSFVRRSVLPFEITQRGYGALTFLPDGRLIAYVYNQMDEKHLDCVISRDDGKTWGASGKSFFAKQIRNPQIAMFKGGYVLHGRSGNKGEDEMRGNFVLYCSQDGIRWDEGQYLQMRTAGAGAYSNNLLVHSPGAQSERLLIQASHAYEQNQTNIHHWWLS
ncbi:MAG: glycoside hydrolase, partial [Lentisphaerae bacterium]|nr:glycoside hydrolase [Lentisphaerota bacterium]